MQVKRLTVSTADDGKAKHTPSAWMIMIALFARWQILFQKSCSQRGLLLVSENGLLLLSAEALLRLLHGRLANGAILAHCGEVFAPVNALTVGYRAILLNPKGHHSVFDGTGLDSFGGFDRGIRMLRPNAAPWPP